MAGPPPPETRERAAREPETPAEEGQHRSYLEPARLTFRSQRGRRWAKVREDDIQRHVNKRETPGGWS
jgi:hypothetical protein